jgi:hypothetical protein
MESHLNAPPAEPDSFINDGHIRGAVDDMRTYSEEAITAAAYDAEVDAILRPIVVSDSAELPVSDLRFLQDYLQREHGLRGDDLTRAIYRCALKIRRQEGIKGIID